VAITIRDNGENVGAIGNGGTLSWDRYPGPMRLFGEFNWAVGNRFLQPIDIITEAGKTYHFRVSGMSMDFAYIKEEKQEGRLVEETNIVGRPNVITFYVVSDPPGARIEGDGQLLGFAPCPVPYKVHPQLMSATTTLRATPANMDSPRIGFDFRMRWIDGCYMETTVVNEVAPLSPAMKMGLQPEDQIMAVNDQVVSNSQQCAELVRAAGFGGDIKLQVKRNDILKELVGKTYERPTGTYYVQEKNFSVARLAGMDKGVIHFDLRVPGLQAVTLGDAISASPSLGAATGTGFIIASNGYALTCYHVVQGRKNISIRLHDGKVVKAKVVSYDEQDDWCVMKIPDSDLVPLSIAPPRSLKNGATVFCLGYPMEGVLESNAPVAGTGNIAALQGMKGDRSHIQITIPINPGNSGSPILDDKGRWIALASHKLNDIYSIIESGNVPQGINFATKASVIEPLLAEVDDLVLPRDGIGKLSNLEEIVTRCAKSIVMVVAE